MYQSPGGQKDLIWLCNCDCGNIAEIRQSKLLSKTRPTLSCGCLRVKRLKEKHPAIKHGESHTSLYNIWHGMKDRCHHTYGKKNIAYANKNINVCSEWESDYTTFKEWALANGYKKGLSLDRIDPYGNYEPENCRFTDWQTQNNNRVNNRIIVAWGESKSLAMWLNDPRCKIGRESLKTRLNSGWNVEKALTTPPTKKFTGNGHQIFSDARL